MGYELYFETCNIFLPSLRIPSVNQGKFGKTSIRVRFVATRFLCNFKRAENKILVYIYITPL